MLKADAADMMTMLVMSLMEENLTTERAGVVHVPLYIDKRRHSIIDAKCFSHEDSGRERERVNILKIILDNKTHKSPRTDNTVVSSRSSSFSYVVQKTEPKAAF